VQRWQCLVYFCNQRAINGRWQIILE
jgi:hypothetical protein